MSSGKPKKEMFENEMSFAPTARHHPDELHTVPGHLNDHGLEQVDTRIVFSQVTPSFENALIFHKRGPNGAAFTYEGITPNSASVVSAYPNVS